MNINSNNNDYQQLKIKRINEYDKIYSLVFDWGIKHHKLPKFNSPNDEQKHFGKCICEFSKAERLGYEDGVYELERFFELGVLKSNDI